MTRWSIEQQTRGIAARGRGGYHRERGNRGSEGAAREKHADLSVGMMLAQRILKVQLGQSLFLVINQLFSEKRMASK